MRGWSEGILTDSISLPSANPKKKWQPNCDYIKPYLNIVVQGRHGADAETGAAQKEISLARAEIAKFEEMSFIS